MADYLGDFADDAVVRGSFNTRDAAGAPITLAGTPTLAVYKDAGSGESTAGVTLTVDFDSRTGHHVFVIDTSADAFYTTDSDYRVVLTAGTVDGTSVVGVCVGSFSIENRYMRGTDNANTTTPPTASANATAVRTELATELGRIDATVSSRSTLTAQQVWEYSTRSLTTFGTVVSDIATAVWGAGTRTLTAIGDSSGVTTLLARIPGTIRTATEDAIAESAQTTAIRNGLATTNNVSDAQDAITAILGDMKGTTFDAFTDSLEAIRNRGDSAWVTGAGGGGGDLSVTIVPLTGVVEERVKGTNIKAFVGETSTVAIACIDAEGNAVTLTGKTLSVVIEGRTRTDKTVIPNGSITISGSTFSFALPSAVTAAQATYKWSLRQASDNGVLMHGLLVVEYAAKADS